MKNKKTCKNFTKNKMSMDNVFGGMNLSDRTGSAGGYTDSQIIGTNRWDIYQTKLIDVWETQQGADRPSNV
jgi:hypothetical protein